MKSGPLKIGIACFPLIGGSGIWRRRSGQSWRAAAMKSTSSVTLNLLGWTCRRTIFISIELMLRITLCFRRPITLCRSR